MSLRERELHELEPELRRSARLVPYPRRRLSPAIRLGLLALRVYTLVAILVVVMVFAVSLKR